MLHPLEHDMVYVFVRAIELPLLLVLKYLIEVGFSFS